MGLLEARHLCRLTRRSTRTRRRRGFYPCTDASVVVRSCVAQAPVTLVRQASRIAWAQTVNSHRLPLSLAALTVLLNMGGCGKPTTVSLTVICDKTLCRDADVLIDGHFVGKMTEKAPGAFFHGTSISPGPHEITVMKDGKLLYEEKFSPRIGASEHYVSVEPRL